MQNSLVKPSVVIGLRAAASRLKAKSFNRFRRDEDGSLIIFSLFLLIMMLMISGMAVDLMRAETHRARLQSTLDRAVLAGASLEQTLNSKAVVLDYFERAGLGSFISINDITVVEDATSKTVTATANMTANTYFMNMLGIDNLSSPAAGQAEESLSDVEISLVLDVSGSMGGSSASGNSKINDLIAAANEFVYLMQCDPDAEQPFNGTCVVEPNTISISLIPYAEQVLVGEELLQEFNITNEHTYSSCVDFEPNDFLTTSTPLLATLQRAGNLDRRSYHNAGQGHGSDTRFARDIGYTGSSGRTCRTQAYRTIAPFVNNYIDLQTKISALRAGGYTSIQLGMKWATTLLDPDFQPALTNLTVGATPLIDPAFDGRPFDYSRPRTKKVVVLMTDGKNTSLYSQKDNFRSGLSPFFHNTAPGTPEDNQLSVRRTFLDASNTPYYKYYWVKDNLDDTIEANYEPVPYGTNDPSGTNYAVQLTYPQLWEIYNVDYWDDEFLWLPDSWDYTGGSTMDTYLVGSAPSRNGGICRAARDQGIEIFTLGFETSTSSSAIMAACASSVAHHFNVDGTDISAAFNSIARQIQELRLTN